MRVVSQLFSQKRVQSVDRNKIISKLSMNKILFYPTAILLGFISLVVFGQNQQSGQKVILDIEVEETYAIRGGKTKALRDCINLPSQDKDLIKQAKRDRKPIQNYKDRDYYGANREGALPVGEDPVRQRSIDRNVSVPVEPIFNVLGLHNGSDPQDPTGDIGKDHYVQAINSTTIRVYNKMGQPVAPGFSGNTLWNQIGYTGVGDPIILYDQGAERWIITEFTASGTNQLLVAVSEDSDPLGEYTAYNFGAPNFPDYPKYAIWDNALIVTTNEQGPSASPVYLIDRQALLNGEETVSIQRIAIPGIGFGGPGFLVASPVEWTGMNPPKEIAKPTVVRMKDDSWAFGNDKIDFYEFDIDWNNSNNTSITNIGIDIASFDSDPCSTDGNGNFPCVPQGGSGGGLDAQKHVIMHLPKYRNFNTHESIVMSFVVDATGGDVAGVRWIEFRRDQGESDWSVYQEGTFAPFDGKQRYMSSIAMDGAGNIGMAYCVSSEDDFVGIRFTGRSHDDPLHMMTFDEYEITPGFNTINSSTRLGDYADMCIDPYDDRTFYHTSEYADGGNGNARTRIFAFKAPPEEFDIGPIALVSPSIESTQSTTAEVQVEITNHGLQTVNDFEVGFIFQNGAPVIESVEVDIEAEDSYVYTFAQTVDIEALGEYEFKLFTNMDNDNIADNDTIVTTYISLLRHDAGITEISGINDDNCFYSKEIGLTLNNFGGETLNSVLIMVENNGEIIQTIGWNGSLEFDQSETYNITLTNLPEGENELVAYTVNPNGEVDEDPSNDSVNRSYSIMTDGMFIAIEIDTDDSPNETTWTLETSDGETIDTGGPYSEVGLYRTEYCLPYDACYVLTLFDSFGNGFCCSEGLGRYTVKRDDGSNIVSSTGVFTDMEAVDFCTEEGCFLNADIDVSSETNDGANDGAILLSASSGNEPYQYSIDGGNEYTDSDMFTGLESGSYEISIIDAADCEFTQSVFVSSCAVNVAIETSSPSSESASDAVIDMSISAGIPPYSYSIDGGSTNSDSGLFENLSGGVYNIVINDAVGCSYEEAIDLTLCVLDASPNVSNESSEGAGDGEIEIDVANGQGNIQYSFDGGANFTGVNVFSNLSAGTYEVVVESDNGCSFEMTVVLAACSLTASTEITNETNSDSNGTIEITASNDGGSIEFSIDGGSTYQSDNVFSGLAAGDYNVVVQDDSGCKISEEVTIDMIVGLDDIPGLSIVVLPNPTDGLFKINITGLKLESPLLSLEIYDYSGKLIQLKGLVKYNDTYTGSLSLEHYPSGIYFVKFNTDKINRMVKVMKK